MFEFVFDEHVSIQYRVNVYEDDHTFDEVRRWP